MNCYQHQEASAIGMCKACLKAVCTSCSSDIGNGLACSDECKKEIIETSQVIERSKAIYGIGDNAINHKVPSGILTYLFFSVIFLGWSVFEYLTQSHFNIFLSLMGAGFGIIGFIAYRRAKEANINC